MKAQSSTIVGLEFGPKWDQYQLTDTTDLVSISSVGDRPFLGFTLAHEINGQLRFETGFNLVNYGKDIQISGENGPKLTSGIESFQIPVRLKLRINIGDGQFRILPMLGYVFGFNRNRDQLGIGYFCSGQPCVGEPFDSVTTRYIVTYDRDLLFHMVQGGLFFEYQINEGPIFSLSGVYTRGLNRILELNIEDLSATPVRKADLFASGAYVNLALGVAYPVSRIWQGVTKVERDWEK
jgi:hypothetical protein